jgi:transposase-like protein
VDRKQLQRLSEAETAQMTAAYQDGKSVYELAPMFGIHRTTVGIILRRHGVTTGKQGIPKNQWADAVRLRLDEGWTYQAIADHYGVS